MSSNVFRSNLMQQFVSVANRHHHRPPKNGMPLGSLCFHTESADNDKAKPYDNDKAKVSLKKPVDPKVLVGTEENTVEYKQNECRISTPSVPEPNMSLHSRTSHRLFTTKNNQESLSHESFQQFIKTRRTTSNFVPLNELSLSDHQNIYDALSRSVECGIQAPNHYRTEPTTYYRIKPFTPSWESLLDIVYNVSLIKGRKQEEITDEVQFKAETKRNKWRDTVAGYLVVCVSGQPLQDQGEGERSSDEMDELENQYGTLRTHPPETETQMEDYASACASIQNILLSLHAEGLGAKWATGPIPNCRATRKLVNCDIHDLIAGIVMVGVPRVNRPKELRKRRDFAGDIFKDL